MNAYTYKRYINCGDAKYVIRNSHKGNVQEYFNWQSYIGFWEATRQFDMLHFNSFLFTGDQRY